MLDKNDRRYIIRRIITYISIAFIMVLLNLFCPLFKAKAAEVQNPSTIYWWCNSQRSNGNISYQNDEWKFTMSCTNANFQRYLQEWYLGSTQPVGKYRLTIPNNPSLNIYDFSDRQPVITLLNYNVSWTNPIYSGVCSKDNSMFIECEFYANEPFNYINMSSPVGVGSSGSTYVTLRTGQYQLTRIVDNEDIQVAIDNMNDSLTNEDRPSDNEISGNTSQWSSLNANNGVINQLVLMPITLLNSFVNGINGSCSPYDFGELWGEHLIFPCIDLSQTLGSVWTIIDVILSGMFIFIFGKRCVKIFNDFTNLRSGQIDTLYGGDN